MKRVFKYSLDPTDFQTVELPVGAQILCVQTQMGRPQLWAMVDPAVSAVELRGVWIFGTGNPIECGEVTYLGTFQAADGALVFHVFEELV